MSRICVKNLPKYVAEDHLREFFSQKGEVTDAKLMRTKDGKSRQFGFVGFRTEEETIEALKYFNKSFMDTCRITCEIAHKIGDPNIPRPWSRHTLKKQVEIKEVIEPKSFSTASSDGKKKKGKSDNENDDPQLQEFLQVMQSRSKSKLWANDTLANTSIENSENKGNNNENRVEKKGKDKFATGHADIQETDDEEDGSLDRKPDAKSEKLTHDDVSGLDYFKSRIRTEWSDSDSSDDDMKNDEDDENEYDDDDGRGKIHEGLDVQKVECIEKLNTIKPSEKGSEDGHDKKSDIEMIELGDLSRSLNDEKEFLESGRLFVRNLPYTATEDELEELFSKFGNTSEVHLVVDKDTKRSKGIAYVLYTLPESATRALEELDNSIFQGRLLHLMPAKPKDPPKNQGRNVSTNLSSKTFKQQREEEKKISEASGSSQAWNSLFVRPDTVVENIARKFGVSKSDLLEKEADDLAVSIALGETQVIAETKKALADAGVNIALLEEVAAGKTDGVKRSSHIILVKNLPYASSEGELAKMFGKFGSLDKIILPPSKTLALVVFLEAAEARAAFKGLAYKRYKDAPLYLEWAPGNILTGSSTSTGDANRILAVGQDDVKRVLLQQEVEGITDEDQLDPDRIESRSLFVKNLNFRTSEESLKKHFTQLIKGGRILSVRINKHLKNGKNVSMGFGFIEFDSVGTARNVCRDFQGTVLDGHALIMQLCHAKNDEKILKKDEKDRSSTKLIVRNVAFEATEKDLRHLFSPFGQIKSLRLPMRFGNHRGFAFVEYATKQETQNALQALSSTHLYGRHLVLEKAKEGETLEELRARTAAHFNDEQNPNRSSKKRKMMSILNGGSVKFERITD